MFTLCPPPPPPSPAASKKQLTDSFLMNQNFSSPISQKHIFYQEKMRGLSPHFLLILLKCKYTEYTTSFVVKHVGCQLLGQTILLQLCSKQSSISRRCDFPFRGTTLDLLRNLKQRLSPLKFKHQCSIKI